MADELSDEPVVGPPSDPAGDDTVPLESVEPIDQVVDEVEPGGSDDRPVWRPGPRLSGRVEAEPASSDAGRRGGSWFIAAMIILAALLVAVGLWVAALWAGDDEDTTTALVHQSATFGV